MRPGGGALSPGTPGKGKSACRRMAGSRPRESQAAHALEPEGHLQPPAPRAVLLRAVPGAGGGNPGHRRLHPARPDHGRHPRAAVAQGRRRGLLRRRPDAAVAEPRQRHAPAPAGRARPAARPARVGRGAAGHGRWRKRPGDVHDLQHRRRRAGADGDGEHRLGGGGGAVAAWGIHLQSPAGGRLGATRRRGDHVLGHLPRHRAAVPAAAPADERERGAGEPARRGTGEPVRAQRTGDPAHAHRRAGGGRHAPHPPLQRSRLRTARQRHASSPRPVAGLGGAAPEPVGLARRPRRDPARDDLLRRRPGSTAALRRAYPDRPPVPDLPRGQPHLLRPRGGADAVHPPAGCPPESRPGPATRSQRSATPRSCWKSRRTFPTPTGACSRSSSTSARA